MPIIFKGELKLFFDEDTNYDHGIRRVVELESSAFVLGMIKQNVTRFNLYTSHVVQIATCTISCCVVTYIHIVNS